MPKVEIYWGTEVRRVNDPPDKKLMVYDVGQDNRFRAMTIDELPDGRPVLIPTGSQTLYLEQVQIVGEQWPLHKALDAIDRYFTLLNESPYILPEDYQFYADSFKANSGSQPLRVIYL